MIFVSWRDDLAGKHCDIYKLRKLLGTGTELIRTLDSSIVIRTLSPATTDSLQGGKSEPSTGSSQHQG